MKIAFLYVGGRIHRLERVVQGKAMDDFFYGSLELRAKGHEVGLFELSEKINHSFIRVIGNFLITYKLLPPKTNGYLLSQTKDVIETLSEYEVVVVAGSPVVFALSIWKQLGRLKIPIVGIHCGLFNFNYNAFRRNITNYLLRRTWTLLFGDGEYKPLLEFMKNGADRIIVNQCGTDTNFWTPGGLEADYILSIGNDGRRDYNLLMKVAAEIKVPFKVVTRLNITEPAPQNVEIIAGDMRMEILTDEDIRNMYRNAICVVIPLIESLQPSGQSVCLQAMACGKPVIMTRTSGLWSESIMRDGENVLFVPPGDKDALIKKIKYLLDYPIERKNIGKRAWKTVVHEFDMRGYADRIEQVCQLAVTAGH